MTNIILCGSNWIGCRSLEMLRERQYNLFVFTHNSPYHIPSLVDLCDELSPLFNRAYLSGPYAFQTRYNCLTLLQLQSSP